MINEELWALLEAFYNKNQEIKCGNVSDEEVCAAEKLLKLQFSDFYRFFLKNHAVTKVGKFSFNSLSSNQSVVDATINFRNTKQYLEYDDYYIIAADQDGNTIGCGSKGEICILHSDRIAKQKLAKSLEEFVQLALEEVAVEIA